MNAGITVGEQIVFIVKSLFTCWADQIETQVIVHNVREGFITQDLDMIKHLMKHLFFLQENFKRWYKTFRL